MRREVMNGMLATLLAFDLRKYVMIDPTIVPRIPAGMAAEKYNCNWFVYRIISSSVNCRHVYYLILGPAMKMQMYAHRQMLISVRG